MCELDIQADIAPVVNLLVSSTWRIVEKDDRVALLQGAPYTPADRVSGALVDYVDGKLVVPGHRLRDFGPVTLEGKKAVLGGTVMPFDQLYAWEDGFWAVTARWKGINYRCTTHTLYAKDLDLPLVKEGEYKIYWLTYTGKSILVETNIPSEKPEFTPVSLPPPDNWRQLLIRDQVEGYVRLLSYAEIARMNILGTVLPLERLCQFRDILRVLNGEQLKQYFGWTELPSPTQRWQVMIDSYIQAGADKQDVLKAMKIYDRVSKYLAEMIPGNLPELSPRLQNWVAASPSDRKNWLSGQYYPLVLEVAYLM